jgi:hypothetical protein
MYPRDVIASASFPVGQSKYVHAPFNLVNMDNEKTQQVCFQRTNGRCQTCSRRDHELRLTALTLTDRTRAQGQP